MATPQEVIQNFMSSLDNTTYRSTAALNEAVQSVSNFSSWSEVINTLVKDCQAFDGDSGTFLEKACGIILDNEDTGAITGSDAGGSETKTAESVVPEEGDWTYPTSTSFTIRGLTVTVPEQSTLDESQQYIVGALYTWWIEQALILSEESFGLNFEEAGTSVNEIDVQFYDSSDGRLAAVDYETGQKSTTLHLKINMHYYEDIDQTNPNGYSSSAAIVYLDRTIAHEMVHAVMAANIDYFNNLPTSFKEGSAELVHGIDDKRHTVIQNLASSYSTLRSAFTGSGSSTYAAGYILLRYLAKQASEDRDPSADILNDDSTDTDTTDTGTTTETTDTDTTIVEPTETTDTDTTIVDPTETATTDTTTYSAVFSEDGTYLTVAGDFPDNIWLGGVDEFNGSVSEYGNASTITLDASQVTTNIILAGNDQNNYIEAGSGGSSLWGGEKGDDTLVGGDGSDMFWLSINSEHDLALNFTTGKDSDSDVVNIFSDGLTSITREGEYVILTMADGSALSIEAGSEVDEVIRYSFDATNISNAKIGDSSSENSFTYDSDVDYYLGSESLNNTLYLTDETGDNNIWLTSGGFHNITIIDAQNSTVNNLIAGSDSEDTIIGGSGSSSLWGGRYNVNDTLIGGSGENVFWYGLTEGNDVIQNAKDADSVTLYDISLSDIVSAEEIDGNFVMTTRLGSLTITDGAAPTMNFADGASRRFNYETQSLEETS